MRLVLIVHDDASSDSDGNAISSINTSSNHTNVDTNIHAHNISRRPRHQTQNTHWGKCQRASHAYQGEPLV